MTTELSAMPAAFPAGTTVRYRKAFAEYQADDGWALAVRLVGALQAASATVTTEGSEFIVTFSATDTAALSAGPYRWVERASKAGDVADVATGTVDVTPNLGAVAAGGALSWEEQTLAVVEAALKSRLTVGMESYVIAGRSIKTFSPVELMSLRDQLRAKIARRRNPSRPIGRSVVARFTPPGGVR